MKKIIFLDVDGVLNSDDWYKSGKAKDLPHPLFHFSPDHVAELNRVIKETGAEIVVSSVWRFGKTLEQLQGLMDDVGVVGVVIGKTEQISLSDKYDGYCSCPRGLEIEDFLRVHYHPDYVKDIQYVILDDDNDMLYKQRNNFVRTNAKRGLTMEKAQHAIKILNG